MPTDPIKAGDGLPAVVDQADFQRGTYGHSDQLSGL